MFLPAVGIVLLHHPGVFAAAGGGIQPFGAVVGLDRVFELWRMGPSHVRGGPARHRDQLLRVVGLIIAIPSGIQILAWIATIWTGRPVLRVPMLWMLGFITVFVIGGITGVMVTAVPLDWQVHDSYFVVAHFHYVFVGGVVFPIFGAFAYWLPEDHRADAEREAGNRIVPACVHRLQPDVLPNAHRWSVGHAEARLHVRLRTRLGWPQPALDDWRVHQRRRLRHLRGAHARQPEDGRARRRQPVGRQHARVGDDVAAGAIQLPQDPDHPQPRPAMGHLDAPTETVADDEARAQLAQQTSEREALATTVFDAEPAQILHMPPIHCGRSAWQQHSCS